LPAMVLVLLGLAGGTVRADDLLKETKERLAVEAQRVEREFKQGRSAAYKLVRSPAPDLLGATEKLQTLLAMVRADEALPTSRREVLLVTLKYDLDKVREIAGENRRAANLDVGSRVARAESRGGAASDERRPAEARGAAKDARSVIESRGRSVADSRGDRGKFSDRYTRTMRSVDDSAVPDSRAYSFPKNWAELSRKRSPAQKTTAKERAILKGLQSIVPADFEGAEFEEVLDYLRKALGVSITVDKRALEEVGVTYKTPIRLKLKASARTVLKRLLGDLNLAYVIKDETILITSQERAKQMTTTRHYYLGDLAAVTDLRYGLIGSKIAMLQFANQLVNTITQTIEPQSWKVNNPDAVGVITFNPLTMSLIVKQTAEIHFSLGR
jgi:hypothetical protein